MQPPSITFLEWFSAALDPVLIVVAVVLGWKADQFGKVFIAALIAMITAVLLSWLIHSLGIPWIAPIGRDLPMLLPVRSVTALLLASLAYGLRRAMKR